MTDPAKPPSTTGTLTIGTRGSALALAQASLVRDALEREGVSAVLETITTEGDRRAPDIAWGEGAFVSAIEAALLSGEVDVAVHSAKDIPTDEDPRLRVAAFMERAAPNDVVVTRLEERAGSLADLPSGARVGTDSPRRTAFLRAVRPDLRFHPLHGNVDTRLRKLDGGETDALVLAEAGLVRLGRAERIGFRLDPDIVPPAPGQGALAIQVRADDRRADELVSRLDDPATRRCVEAERALLAATGGGCRSPIGALGRVVDGQVQLTGGYARPDGLVVAIGRRSRPVTENSDSLVETLLDEIAEEAALSALALDVPRVIVTRSLDQRAALMLALVDRGLAPLSVPAIAIELGGVALIVAMRRLATFDWVVATSVNAVRALQLAAHEASVRLTSEPGGSQPRWAAVGSATARALRSAGIGNPVRPGRASGAAIADTLPFEPGDHILVPQSDIAEPGLAEGLTGRGAVVEAITAYRTIEAPPDSLAMLRTALPEAPRAVVLTSGSTARGLLELGEGLGRLEAVRAIPAICIGPGTSAEARRLGYRVVAEAPMQGVKAIADAAAGYLRPQQEPA